MGNKLSQQVTSSDRNRGVALPQVDRAVFQHLAGFLGRIEGVVDVGVCSRHRLLRTGNPHRRALGGRQLLPAQVLDGGFVDAAGDTLHLQQLQQPV